MSESDVNNKDTGLAQVYLWIFEHACKFDMKNVIKSILKKYHASNFIKDTLEKWGGETPAPVHPDFLFKFFLKNLYKSLTYCVEDQQRINFKPIIDFDLLNLVVDLLEHIYRKAQFMTFRNFTNLVSRLKLLELICRIHRTEPIEIITKRLKLLFPRWDSAFELLLMQRFELSNVDELKHLKKSHLGIRNYILQLLASKGKREKYFSANYKTDVTDILNFTTKHLKKILIKTSTVLSLTAIEQIANGGWEDLQNIDDPAIQILLDNLYSGIKEKELERIVDILSPNCSNIPLLKHCFEPTDTVNKEFEIDQNCEEMNSVEKVKKWLEPAVNGSDTSSDIQINPVRRLNCKRQLFFHKNQRTSELVECSSLNSIMVINKSGQDGELEKHFNSNLKKKCLVNFYRRGVIECNGKNFQLYS